MELRKKKKKKERDTWHGWGKSVCDLLYEGDRLIGDGIIEYMCVEKLEPIFMLRVSFHRTLVFSRDCERNETTATKPLIMMMFNNVSHISDEARACSNCSSSRTLEEEI